MRSTLVLPVLAVAFLAPSPARADGGAPGGRDEIRVDRLAGDALTAKRLLEIDRTRAVLETAAGRAEVPLADVVEFSFPTQPDAPRPWATDEVALELWTGETVLGALKGGDGEKLSVETALLGRLDVALDRIAALRFLRRLSQAAEPPDLRPRPDGDVIHIVGGDRFAGTVEEFTAKGVRSVTLQKDSVEVPYERLLAVVLMSEAHAAPKADPDDPDVLRVALRDGSRLVARGPRVVQGRLVFRSPSGFEANCVLADVVAAQAVSTRFSFLSDLAPASTTVRPVWEVTAGDPAVLFAPRLDRSFGGRPLRSGGRAWLDGIGVFSGTTLTWDLDGKYSEFRTSAGIDDGAGPLGGVVFRVLVDGREVWNSGFLRPAGTEGRGTASPVASPRIRLEGAKSLTLEVLAGDEAEPYPVQDEADWLGAIVVRAGAEK